MAYTVDDIQIIDSMAAIRRAPRLYAGDPPRAARLAAKMVGDLLQFGMRSVSAEAFGAWWLITSQSDWLTSDGVYHAEYWRRVVVAPEIGLQAMRPEVLLTAFSSALVTVARESMEFIVGAEVGNEALQAKLRTLMVPEFRGRAVGFLIDE